MCENEKTLTIAIPTYNRGAEIVKNLSIVCDAIIKYHLEERVDIIVSDNNSAEIHVNALRNFLAPQKISLQKYYQEKNVEYVGNTLFLLENADSDYIMFIGDDDYIDPRYLKEVINCIDEGCYAILGNFFPVDEEGNQLDEPRDEESENRYFEGLDSVKEMALAHQMSGLVFRKEGVLASFLENCSLNAYQHMYFIGINLVWGKGVHITKYPIRNTIPNVSRTNYTFDLLLNVILYNVNSLPIERKKTKSIMAQVIDFNRARLCTDYSLKHPFAYMRRINREYKIDKSFKFMVKLKFWKYYIREFIKRFLLR